MLEAFQPGSRLRCENKRLVLHFQAPADLSSWSTSLCTGLKCPRSCSFWGGGENIFFSFLKNFLLLFNYSCMPFLPVPPPHPSRTHQSNNSRGGQWEEGIAGTIIKDTWTKSRGRVEVGEGGGFSWGGVEGWGEKAHNCN